NDKERKRKIHRYLKQWQLYKQGIIEQLIAYFEDPLFKKIMLLSPDREIDFLKEQLKKFKSYNLICISDDFQLEDRRSRPLSLYVTIYNIKCLKSKIKG